VNTVGDRDIVGYRLDQDTTEVPLLVSSEYDEVSPQLSPTGAGSPTHPGDRRVGGLCAIPFPT